MNGALEYEPFDTQQFTWVSSYSPDQAPTFVVYGPIASRGIIASFSAVDSGDGLHYYALYSMPNTPGEYTASWRANKTLIGSTYLFVRSFDFRVKRAVTLL